MRVIMVILLINMMLLSWAVCSYIDNIEQIMANIQAHHAQNFVPSE